MVYTSLKQSKTLSKILPLKSADMYYSHEFVNSAGDYYKINIASEGYFDDEELLGSDIPAWSLDALLTIIAKQNFIIKSWYIDGYEYNIDIPCRHCKIWFPSLLDAAFETILWLKENKKL